MSKIYCFVLDENGYNFRAILDLDRLPDGATSSEVRDPVDHSFDVIAWLQKDLARVKRLVCGIRSNQVDTESVAFISSLASLWENFPPAAEEKDAVMMAREGRCDFIRTSPEVARDMFKKLGAIGTPG